MTIGIGHNMAGERLLSFVKRIERVQGEIDDSNADKREIFAEAKGDGFNVKTLKRLIRERREDPADRKEQGELFDLYWDAIDGAAKTKANVATMSPAREVVDPDPETSETTEEPTAAEKAQGRAALGEGHEFDREGDDAEKEQVPEQSASEEVPAAAAEDEPKISGTTTADTTWTCAACGWAGMASMVTDECPDCGASTGDGAPRAPGIEDIPDFLDRRGELPG